MLTYCKWLLLALHILEKQLLASLMLTFYRALHRVVSERTTPDT